MKLIVRAATVLCFVTVLSPQLLAQQGATVSGVVTNKSDNAAVVGALVVLESTTTHVETKTGADGKFTMAGVPPGSYHLIVRADGFLLLRSDVAISASQPAIEVQLNADPHYSEVVSVGPEPRNQFDAYQPTSVLGGQDLAKQLQGTIGATIANQPGVASRSFGPGPARPVIRGLDGDRVLVLEDGKRMGDLSSQSGDHGVNVNPASATTIEVVRGPATLLYGANAIGGLVNVVTNSIPTAQVTRTTGSVTLTGGSAAREAGIAGDLTAGTGALAVHLSASGQRAGNYKTPDSKVPNSFNRGGFGEVGLSYVQPNGYIGVSAGYDKTRYGIPFVEDGETNLNPRRKVFDVRAERNNLSGPFASFRASVGIRRYNHDELDGDEVVTAFTNKSSEFELRANHRQMGKLKGTLGFWGLKRDFLAEGEEALSPQVKQSGVAGFLYEEATLSSHVSFQFGGRVEHASFKPVVDFPDRDFTNVSGSLGLVIHPSDATTLAVSVARAERNPALEELYFHGPHPGNNAFENGNEDLKSERAIGFDVSFRWHASRMSGEATYFYNRLNNFIFRQPTGEVEDDLPVTFFTQGKATLNGVESHMDLKVTDTLWLEGGLDYVRGELTSQDDPLPRVPPLRGRLGVRVQKNALQGGIDATFTRKQDRVFEGETRTDGYQIFKAFLAYSFEAGGATNTLALRLDNAGNKVYRNHLNYLKDLTPEVGRDVRITYTIRK